MCNPFLLAIIKSNSKSKHPTTIAPHLLQWNRPLLPFLVNQQELLLLFGDAPLHVWVLCWCNFFPFGHIIWIGQIWINNKALALAKMELTWKTRCASVKYRRLQNRKRGCLMLSNCKNQRKSRQHQEHIRYIFCESLFFAYIKVYFCSMNFLISITIETPMLQRSEC